MSDQRITDEYVRNVRAAVTITTYLLRHPSRFTSNTCGEMRDARRAATDLLDQILLVRADLEHMTPEQREAYIRSEGRYVVLPPEEPHTPFDPPVLQSTDSADDIPF